MSGVEVAGVFAVDVVVEDVSLLGSVTGFGDLVTEVAFVGFVVGTGGGDDVFFDHDRAHIVGAESQGGLAETYALGQPRRLDVLNVVEEQPRYGEHL